MPLFLARLIDDITVHAHETDEQTRHLAQAALDDEDGCPRACDRAPLGVPPYLADTPASSGWLGP